MGWAKLKKNINKMIVDLYTEAGPGFFSSGAESPLLKMSSPGE